ncbi:MAG: cytochrome c oxidase subunit 3 [Planctomycetota bacterium]
MNEAAPTTPNSPPPEEPPPSSGATIFSPPGQRPPRGTGELGMYLFLAALAMLFISSMLGYVLVRWSKTITRYDPTDPQRIIQEPTAPAFGTLEFPLLGLLVSTAIILASSVTMHLAIKNVQLERQKKFRASLIATLVLSILFCIVQTPCMISLLSAHDAGNINNTMYGIVFFLVLVHALHVLGGIIPLAVTTYKAGQHRYDHEHYGPVKFVGMYWHFLDGVWLFMFAVLLVVR